MIFIFGRAFTQFTDSYQIKFPKACECLEKDKEVLFSFLRLYGPTLAAPADHQSHRIDLRYRPATKPIGPKAPVHEIGLEA